MTTEKRKGNIKVVIPSVITYIVGIGIGNLTGYSIGTSRAISQTDTQLVQPGYIQPRDLRVHSTDVNNDAQLETLVDIGEKSYLFKYVDNKPTLVEYMMKPAELVEIK